MTIRQLIPEDLAQLAPGPELGVLLGGLDISLLTGTDLVEVLRARRLSHEQAQLLAVMVEVGLCDPHAGPDEVARLAQAPEYAADEIRAALAWTRNAALREYHFAETLLTRLPTVFTALDTGTICRSKAWLFTELCAELTDEQIQVVCERLLPDAARLTTGELAARIKKLALTRYRQVLGNGHPGTLGSAHNLTGSPQRDPDWSATRARFDKLRIQYAQFECDPLAVLRLPALTDVTVPATARFVDAFASAQALDADTEPPAAHCTRFTDAVDQAWRAWQTARDAAQRIRLAGNPADERATVQRAIKLLIMATHESGHDAERIAAYTMARAELAKLERSGTLSLPPAAAAALDTAARSQLPPGRTAG